MIFIYNALEQGWIVKKKSDGVYEFTKERKHEERDLRNYMRQNSNGNENNQDEDSKFKWLEDYLRHFLELNSKMDIILANK